MLFCFLSFLRFNSHDIDFKKQFKIDKWLKNPALNIYSYNTSFSLAFGGEEDFSYSPFHEGSLELSLRLKKNVRNCFYITVNWDMDGASTTLIHFRRKGFEKIHSELIDWLQTKKIDYKENILLERILNENLFFNYFFSIGKDMESDRYVAMTSRSPRYYVSGAFWERDSFLWSFPAIKLIDKKLYLKIAREMMVLHGKNAGDHAHYIDGTVLYPGFELDEAGSYFILLKDFEEYDVQLLKISDEVLNRIEKEYDKNTGLYRLYNDPPGNLGLLPYYGFVYSDNEVFVNTIKYYYSNSYNYYFLEANIRELACDHHPDTPSGLGLCGSILNPIMRSQAILWLLSAPMDYGLLCESFDKDTGEARTGVGFATGSGYLAFALYNALIGED